MAVLDHISEVTDPVLAEAVPLLIPLYGERELMICDTNLNELIYTLLSHRTNKRDEQEAFQKMWALFKTWEGIQNAPLDELIEAIALSRFPERKAPYIQGTLAAIYAQRGEYSIDFLADLSPEAALEWLMALPGVGLKTATLVLLFCFHKPFMPVDTHVHRVTQRLGVLTKRTTPEQAHFILLERLPPDAHFLYNFHKLFLKHGQELCTFSHPRCPKCPLRHICEYFKTEYAQGKS